MASGNQQGWQGDKRPHLRKEQGGTSLKREGIHSPRALPRNNPLEAFTIPWNAPQYPNFPIALRGVTILTAFWRTTPEAAAAVLPPPLRSTGPIVAAQIYTMPDVTGSGAGKECNVMVAAELDGSPAVSGGFSVLLVLDNDVGVTHGREVHGQPKKLGSPSLSVDGDLVVGRVARNGIEVLTVTTPYKLTPSNIETMRGYFDSAENLNYKVLPNIDGTAAVRQITARRLQKLVVHECWIGPCSVELRPNVQAPLWQLPVVEPLAAFYWKADFTLEPGRVLHDYLRAPS
jgi:acetoacetate decarboxylase